MRIGALAGALVGIALGLALAIGVWSMLLVVGLGVAGFAVGAIAVDARRPSRDRPARRTPRRYERDDLVDDLEPERAGTSSQSRERSPGR
jgi:hypothetical protein